MNSRISDYLQKMNEKINFILQNIDTIEEIELFKSVEELYQLVIIAKKTAFLDLIEDYSSSGDN